MKTRLVNLRSEQLSAEEEKDKFNKQLILRRLLNELASLLSQSMTFNQIAKIFFESGIIDTPERPYGVYPGSKSQYSLEKLMSAQNEVEFPEMLHKIYFDLCWDQEGPEISGNSILPLMEALGYEAKEEKEGWDPFLKVPNRLPSLNITNKTQGRIKTDNLPSSLTQLLNELNDNLERKNFNACALLIRKILTLSCFIALDKIGKSSLLDEKELSEVLSSVQQELKVSHIVMAKVKSAKWLGDSANHSYKMKINESDIEVAITGLRIFLEEIF